MIRKGCCSTYRTAPDDPTPPPPAPSPLLFISDEICAFRSPGPWPNPLKYSFLPGDPPVLCRCPLCSLPSLPSPHPYALTSCGWSRLPALSALPPLYPLEFPVAPAQDSSAPVNPKNVSLPLCARPPTPGGDTSAGLLQVPAAVRAPATHWDNEPAAHGAGPRGSRASRSHRARDAGDLGSPAVAPGFRPVLVCSGHQAIFLPL